MDERVLETVYGPVAYAVRPGASGEGSPGTVPLVFLHGRASDSTQWKGIVERTSPSATVLTVDLPCHGKSRAYEGFLFDRAAEHVAEIMRRNLSGPALVVGHSIGGEVAQALAVRSPDLVAGLVVVDAVPVRPSVYSGLDRFTLKRSATSLRVYEERSVRGLAGGMARELAVTSQGRDELTEIFSRRDAIELCQLVALADGEFVRWIERLEAPLSPACPMWLVCGEKDKLNKVRRIMRSWAKTDGLSLRELSGCGHFCMLDEPGAFSAFVAEVAGRCGPIRGLKRRESGA